MATFKTRISGPGSPYDLVLVVNQGSQSVSGNYSNVSWELYIQKISGYGYWANGTYSWSVNIGGVSRSGSGNSYNFENYSKLTLGSGSVRINHNSNGTKSISASGRWNGLGSLNATSVSGTLGLKTIPRESKITGLSVSSRTTNSITYSWSADKAVSQISYRHSGGGWNTVNASGTSGSFTVGGLSPGRSITVELQVKNRDSGLWSSSSTRSGTTYREATPTNAPGFTVTPGGSANVTVNISRENANIKSIVTLEYWGDNQAWNTLVSSGRGDTSITLPISSTHMNTLMNNRKSSKSITVRYRVDSYWGWSGGKQGSSKYSSQATATISSAAGPTLGNISYQDGSSPVAGITGNNKIILQNRSLLNITVSGGNSRYGASLTKMTVTSAGKSSSVNLSGTSTGSRTFNLGTINVGSNSTATVTIYDSRGYSTSKNISYTVEAYQNPTIIALRPNRKFGYEEPSYVDVTVRISKINGNNKPKFRYRIRPVGGTWGSYQTIDLGSPTNWGGLWQYRTNSYIADYPNNKEYEVEGQVSDALTEWSNTTMALLPKGVPLMKFTQNRVDVGVPLHVEKGIHVKDNRGTMHNPAWYLANRPASVTVEFKSSSDTGLSGGWSAVYTTVMYVDTSVPQVFQIAYNQNGHQYKRVGEGNSWKSWVRLVDAGGGYISGGFNMDGSLSSNSGKGGSWIDGKNKPALIEYNITPGASYNRILRAKANDGYFAVGTIFNRFGVYWHKSSSTVNGTDGGVYVDGTTNELVNNFDLRLKDGKLQDYVIDSGTNYRKWSSGKMEAWGTAAAKTNASGDIRIPYGVKFARAPESIVMTERWNSTPAWKGTPHGQNTEAFNVRCMHMSNGSVYSAGHAHTVWFYVVGEWK